MRDVFDESPFFVPNNSVSIMNGANEGRLFFNAMYPVCAVCRTKKTNVFFKNVFTYDFDLDTF